MTFLIGKAISQVKVFSSAVTAAKRTITTKNEVVATIKRKYPRRPLPKVTPTPAENIQTIQLEDGSILESFIPKKTSDLPTGSVNLITGQATSKEFSATLPPLLKPLKGTQTHLKQLNGIQVAQIKALRLQDPEKYTRKVLARKFGVSPFFISTIAPLSEDQFQKVLKDREDQWNGYGWRRKAKVVDRLRRKELW
jgi:hypothetical protein